MKCFIRCTGHFPTLSVHCLTSRPFIDTPERAGCIHSVRLTFTAVSSAKWYASKPVAPSVSHVAKDGLHDQVSIHHPKQPLHCQPYFTATTHKLAIYCQAELSSCLFPRRSSSHLKLLTNTLLPPKYLRLGGLFKASTNLCT